jgi:hypothetical protein
VKRRPFEIVLVAVGAALLIAIAFARSASESKAVPSVYSTFDTGINGYRAVYNVLAARGVAVQRAELDLGLLDPAVRTLVIATVQPERTLPNTRDAVPLTTRDLPLLEDFMRRGGRLVVLDTDIGDPGDEKLGLPAVRNVTHASSAVVLADVAATAGVRTVRAAVTVAFPFDIRKAVPLLATEKGVVALEYPFGKGEMIAIAAPDVLSNANLAQNDNAQFAFDVLGGHGPVAFDERVHGYVDEDKSFWAALPAPVHTAVWIVVAIVLLGLIGANVRFAAPLWADPPDERDSSQYLTAMASLLRRAHAVRSAVSVFTADAFRRARLRYGLPPQADAAAIVQRTERDDVRRDIAALDRLANVPHPDEAALVRAASINARLRKELG